MIYGIAYAVGFVIMSMIVGAVARSEDDKTAGFFVALCWPAAILVGAVFGIYFLCLKLGSLSP